ncbi:hypothetical protein BDC45DRAFT_415429, partial [Circinella umbellata]
YISVFFFITVLYTNKEYPAPYLEIEKALLLLYHLTEGLTSKTMKQYMPYTTFYSFYKEFWINNYNNLNHFQDCIAVDGGYTLFIKQFENLCKNKNINLDDKNFFYPIRKEIGIALNHQEEHYNKVFGSFRSIVENQFKDLFNKFKRFNNNNSILKTDDIKYINLQLKVAFLLKNINNFSDKFNIIIQDHHKLWFNDNFEFPSEMRLIDIVYTNQMEQVNKLKE